MDKKPLHLGLHSGPPRLYKTEEQIRDQLRQMPKASEPSIATLLLQRGKVTQAMPPIEPEIEPTTGA